MLARGWDRHSGSGTARPERTRRRAWWSSQNAIKIVGAEVVTVDSSILVGQSAVISSRGASLVITRNSVFHGKRDVDGACALIDLGGNTFE